MTRDNEHTPQVTRKAYVCKNCGGVYADQNVTKCDCMPEIDEFIEGVIIYPAAAPVAAQAQPWQQLAAALYQACGAYDMPVRVLDALSAAAHGEPFAHLIDGLLPVESPAQKPVSGADGLPLAWLHEEDPTRVVSASTKAGAEKDGGAILSSLRAYSIPLCKSAQPQPSGNAANQPAALKAGDRTTNGGVFIGSISEVEDALDKADAPHKTPDDTRWLTLPERIAALAAQAKDQDADLSRTIDQRDTAEGWADGLAGLIGKYFGQEIGEHSNAHCPWQEAKDIIEEGLAAQASGPEYGSADPREFANIGKAVNRAAMELPAGWGIRIQLEREAGTVYLSGPDSNEAMIDSGGEPFSEQINAAIERAAAKGEA